MAHVGIVVLRTHGDEAGSAFLFSKLVSSNIVYVYTVHYQPHLVFQRDIIVTFANLDSDLLDGL